MSPVGAAIVPCKYASNQAVTHWLEFELVGEDDLPLPWEEYLVILPDGTRTSGYLDQNGSARLENIAQAGTCRISFPNLDGEAWEEAELVR
jgi:hypothetical protein